MAIWDDVLKGEDREVYEALLKPRELGDRPAVIVVDVNYAFVGTRPMPLKEAIKEFPTSCGEAGWEVIPRIRSVTEAAREQGIPVFYSTGKTVPFSRRWGVGGVGWSYAGSRDPMHQIGDDGIEKQRLGNTLVEELEVQPQDIILEKSGSSVFLGTPLVTYLNDMGVNTLLVTGTTTSGCVRATAVEASNLSYQVGLIEDCVFDRFEISHKVSLMDIHAKYGKVVRMGEALEYMRTIAQPSVMSS